MDRRIEKLREKGCNTSGALERMADDEEFYIECLQEALENPNFSALEKALSAGDTQTAFDCAHALKGVLGNVGLTPMFNVTVQIVEPLRAGSGEFLGDKLEQLNKLRKTFSEILSR